MNDHNLDKTIHTITDSQESGSRSELVATLFLMAFYIAIVGSILAIIFFGVSGPKEGPEGFIMSAEAAGQNTPTPTPDPNDIDGDGIPNSQDPDLDGDGINNISDPDADGDGQHNSVDTDDDNDGTTDSQDATPGGYGTTQETWPASWGGSGPEPTNTPTNTPAPTSTPTNTPTPKLVITEPSPTQTEDRYISATPSMPTPAKTQCKAKLENWQGGTVTFN